MFVDAAAAVGQKCAELGMQKIATNRINRQLIPRLERTDNHWPPK